MKHSIQCSDISISLQFQKPLFILSLTQKPVSERDIDPNFKRMFQHIAGQVSDETRVNSKTWQL